MYDLVAMVPLFRHAFVDCVHGVHARRDNAAVHVAIIGAER